MITVSLVEFLRAGAFGPIRLGMSRSQVQAACGPPEDVSVQRGPLIWKYGDIEFHFARDRFFLIHCDHFDPASGLPRAGERMQLDLWVIQQGISRAEMQRQLTAEQIAWRVVQPIEPHTALLSVGAGVQLLFIEDADDFSPPPGLAALSYSIDSLAGEQ
jgi:hypothetical protein